MPVPDADPLTCLVVAGLHLLLSLKHDLRTSIGEFYLQRRCMAGSFEPVE